MFRSLVGGLVLAGCHVVWVCRNGGRPEQCARPPDDLRDVQRRPRGRLRRRKCRQLIAASGMITAETPRQFLAFTRDNPAQDATVVLESDGGSVLGALELGRAIRRLGLSTTVGRVVERRPKGGAKYGEINSRVDCQSMCTFVLLGGVKRTVPPDAQVLVHQIWLGDRREDAVAASYSAEDLVVVQRDIGSIVQYTVEMGGDIELVQLSLKVPPWEPMRVLTRDELRRTGLDLGRPASPRSRPSPRPRRARRSTQGLRNAANERGWMLETRSGRAVLSRSHPLTVEGERIGNFDLDLRLRRGARNLRPDLQGGPLRTGRPRPAAQHRPGRADHRGPGSGTEDRRFRAQAAARRAGIGRHHRGPGADGPSLRRRRAGLDDARDRKRRQSRRPPSGSAMSASPATLPGWNPVASRAGRVPMPMRNFSPCVQGKRRRPAARPFHAQADTPFAGAGAIRRAWRRSGRWRRPRRRRSAWSRRDGPCSRAPARAGRRPPSGRRRAEDRFP